MNIIPLYLTAATAVCFMVYYLESVYGRPWVENGELQYSEEEVTEALEFITELEEGHVIPTLAVTNGDMGDSTENNPKSESCQQENVTLHRRQKSWLTA